MTRNRDGNETLGESGRSSSIRRTAQSAPKIQYLVGDVDCQRNLNRRRRCSICDRHVVFAQRVRAPAMADVALRTRDSTKAYASRFTPCRCGCGKVRQVKPRVAVRNDVELHTRSDNPRRPCFKNSCCVRCTRRHGCMKTASASTARRGGGSGFSDRGNAFRLFRLGL